MNKSFISELLKKFRMSFLLNYNLIQNQKILIAIYIYKYGNISLNYYIKFIIIRILLYKSIKVYKNVYKI